MLHWVLGVSVCFMKGKEKKKKMLNLWEDVVMEVKCG